MVKVRIIRAGYRFNAYLSVGCGAVWLVEVGGTCHLISCICRHASGVLEALSNQKLPSYTTKKLALFHRLRNLFAVVTQACQHTAGATSVYELTNH